ncbi:MAG: hypothetical protein RL328_2524 [Acidobacteriota bacterium]|jgi:TetR/AcrR family transcriptional regulator
MSSPARTSPALATARKHRLPSEARKQQLIEEAIRLFAQRGFSGTRTKDIAAACGVSEGILFHHFATKEDLYRAILESHADEAGSKDFMEELKRCAAAKDDRRLVHEVLRHILGSFRENAEFHRLMMYAWLEGHAIADLAHQQFGLPVLGFIRSYIAQRQRDGAFRAGDPNTLTMALFAPALQFAMSKYIFGVEAFQQPDEPTVDQFAEFLLGGLQRPQKSGSK